MTKKTEPSSPEARLPKGLFDISAGEIRASEQMLATIRRVFESYGFEPLDTPAIEYTDALGKFLPDQDRPNEGVFSFQDDDEQWLSLRYDLTAPLARYVAENYQTLPKPFRRYQWGPVWRNEKPGPGRFRQFTQFDADTVGAASVAADAELCMLAADTLEALGVPRGQYVVKVNNRKVLDGVLDSASGSWTSENRLAVLRAHRQARPAWHGELSSFFWARAELMKVGRLHEGRGPDKAQSTRSLISLALKKSDFERARLGDAATSANIQMRIASSDVGDEGAEELRARCVLWLPGCRIRRPHSTWTHRSCAGWNITPARCSRPS